MPAPLWQPSPERIAAAHLTRFRAEASQRAGRPLDGYDALHAWSVREPEAFWDLVWRFCGVVAETRGERTVADREKMPGARWFPDARLNFAQNLLRRNDEAIAIVFNGEGRVRRTLSWRTLNEEVSRLQQALHDAGIGQGDRVAGFLPNMPETVVAMLATASLGAIWTSCSPDFGRQGVLDRFGQVEPKLLFAVDGYRFAGRRVDTTGKTAEIAAELPTVERVVMVRYGDGDDGDISGIRGAVEWADLVAPYAAGEPDYVAMPFNAPLYVMYSSGTTGKPKCIVHGAGGTLLQHLKEHRLHADIHPGDRLFYFTTCGWMMWNWLASGLASEATLLLYDGSPFHPGGSVLFDFAQAEGMTHFGTSAKYIDALGKAEVAPARTHRLPALRAMLSTGSPLAPQGFDYVYGQVKADIHLASISGGTDIISCFVLGDPTGPVWRGEIQRPGLGMDVQVFDEDGRPVTGRQGELVCLSSFPSMPVGFWNDPDGARYRAAYFEAWPGVWCHGDWIERTEHGGFVIYGRSDATLNPGGVRIGTAEIYRQVEALPEILEAMAIGQRWENDVRVVLFVRLRDGVALDSELTARIRKTIREGASPRHVPARVIAVPDIPRTVNGKITELAVSDVVHGRPVKNKEALANPEALELFRDLPELRT